MMKKTTMGMLALMLATMTACERVVLDMDEDMDKEYQLIPLDSL